LIVKSPSILENYKDKAMKKVILPCLLMLSLAFGCLGRQRAPLFIKQVGIKVNKWGFVQERLSSLPKDSWILHQFGYSYGELVKADVIGDAAPEVMRVVVNRKGLIGARTSLEIFDGDGQLLNTIQPIGYLSFLLAANLDEDPKQELILFNYPSPTSPSRQTIQIVEPNGKVINSWDCDFQGSFDVIDWVGSPHLLSIEKDAFGVLTVEGNQVARLLAPQAHYFRKIRGKQLSNGSLVILVSGSGYRPFAMVCVFNAQQELVFQDVISGHANGLLTAPDAPNSFLIAYGNEYIQYSSEKFKNPSR